MLKLLRQFSIIKNIHNAKQDTFLNVDPVDWSSFDKEIIPCINEIKNTLISIPYSYIDPDFVEE